MQLQALLLEHVAQVYEGERDLFNIGEGGGGEHGEEVGTNLKSAQEG